MIVVYRQLAVLIVHTLSACGPATASGRSPGWSKSPGKPPPTPVHCAPRHGQAHWALALETENMKIKINCTQCIGLNRWLNCFRVSYLLESIFLSDWIAFQPYRPIKTRECLAQLFYFYLNFPFNVIDSTHLSATQIIKRNLVTGRQWLLSVWKCNILWLSHSWTAVLVCKGCKKNILYKHAYAKLFRNKSYVSCCRTYSRVFIKVGI